MSKTRMWTGRIISWFVVAFLLFDATIHFLQIKPVVDAFTELGYPIHLAPVIAVIELVCILLYITPRTSVLGAVLLTGYLGGAVASNLRIEKPLFGFVLFPVYVGILVWLGIFIRDERIRNLIPFKK